MALMTFSEKLGDLFAERSATMTPPRSSAELSRMVHRNGGELSASHLRELRRGKAAHPSYVTVAEIARAFEVPLDHFVGANTELGHVRESVELAGELRDADTAGLLRRAARLSPRRREAFERALRELTDD